MWTVLATLSRASCGDVIGKDQCKKLQSFIMSIETAKDLGRADNGSLSRRAACFVAAELDSLRQGELG